MRYRYHVDTETLIDECVARLNRQTFPGHVLVVEKGKIVLGSFKVKVESIAGNKVKLTLVLFDADGEEETITQTFKPGDDIAKLVHDDRLRPLGTVALADEGGLQKVLLTNTSLRLAEGQQELYTPDALGGQARERLVQLRSERYPVFNLIDRAAKQTGLTRPTINAIFRRMRDDRKRFLLQNPEGFATVFIGELRNALADHITARIEFVVEDGRSRLRPGEALP